MPAGRPSQYDPKFVDMLDAYFDIEALTDVVVTDEEGNEKHFTRPAELPTLAGFACKVGVARETLWAWANETDEEGNLKRPEFSNAYKRAKDHQERILVANGLLGGYKTAFAVFTAKNVLGWRDKTEVTGADGKDFMPPQQPMPSPDEYKQALKEALQEL